MGKLHTYIVKLYTISCQESVSQHFRLPSSKILCYLVSYYGLIYKEKNQFQKLEKSSFRNSNKTLRKNFQVPTKLNRKLKHRIKTQQSLPFKYYPKVNKETQTPILKWALVDIFCLLRTKDKLCICVFCICRHVCLYSAQILF